MYITFKMDNLDRKIKQIDQRYVRGLISLRQALRLMRRAWVRSHGLMVKAANVMVMAVNVRARATPRVCPGAAYRMLEILVDLAEHAESQAVRQCLFSESEFLCRRDYAYAPLLASLGCFFAHLS